MTLKLDYIIGRSGDSTLISCNYTEGIFSLLFKIDELGFELLLKIKTNIFHCENLKEEDDIGRTCLISLEKLNEFINTNNGFYVPPDSFGQVMKESKRRYNLCYGIKASDKTFFLQARGYYNLASCIINNIDEDIDYEIIGEEGVAS
jgi:hypothetical protein